MSLSAFPRNSVIDSVAAVAAVAMPELWREYGEIARHFVAQEVGPEEAARCWLARNLVGANYLVIGLGAQEKNRRGIEIENAIVAYIIAEGEAGRLTIEGVDAHGNDKQVSRADFRIAGLKFDFNGNRVMRGEAPLIEGAKVALTPNAEPSAGSAMPLRDPSMKQRVHAAAVKILNSGDIPQGHGSLVSLVEKLQPDFPNYDPDTLRKYAGPAHSAWKKRFTK